MLQIYVYDDTGASFELDLYKEEPLKLTLSAEDIGDIPRVNSAFSKQFRVPATQNNSKVFKWWYEVNTVDFDITKRVRADLYSDGLFYKSGHIRIENAYINHETSQVDLELVFFGETRDFASQVGEIRMNELNLTEYNHVLNRSYLLSSWNTAFAPVRYILADRGYTYDSSGNIEQRGAISFEHTTGFDYSFKQSSHSITLNQFTPMVQAKIIIDAIFAQTEYSYSADSYFNEDLFKNMYTDGLPDASPTTTSLDATCEVQNNQTQQFGSSVEDRVEFTVKIDDPTSSFSLLNNEFTCGVAGSHAFSVSVQGFDNTDPGVGGTYTLRLYKNNTVLDTDTASIPAGQSASFAMTVSDTETLAVGDKVYATIEASGGAEQPGLTQATFECTNAPGSIAVASLLKYDIKCIDFLKSILTKFKLVMVPSVDNEFEFIIKPWVDYIASGDRFDWTGKLDTSKDISLKPIFFDQSQLIDFTDQEDEDSRNKGFQEQNTRAYGALQFDSNNDLLKDTREVKTILAPTPVDLITDTISSSTFVIPYLSKFDGFHADSDQPIHTPIKPKPRLLFWNGLVDVDDSDETWYYRAGGNDYEMDEYPRMTYLSDFPSISTTLNLNWFREEPFFPNGAGQNGQSVYERYYNSYIQELYSPISRVLTAYFNLDSQDLRELSFDDIIFIQNAYYRILKVYDAPIAEIQTVKVDLVKILETVTFANDGDPTPGGGGIDDVVVTGGGGSPAPAGDDSVWGTNNNNYGVAPGTWGNPG